MSVTFKHAVLANGLTVIAEVMPSAHSAAAGFFVKTGARDEPSELMGVSHFLEHMMFKGTERRTAADVNREFDEIGANYNAYTSAELTCFYASVLPDMLEQSVDILGDIMRPSLRKDDFDMEKSVILEEIAMYGDVPFWNLYERAIEEYYGKHPLHHRVLGTNQTITDLKVEQMRSYFNERYSADNITVALAGKLDFDTVVKQLDQVCGHWEPTGVTRDNARMQTNSNELIMQDAKVHRGYLLMVAPGPAYDDPRRYAASLLMRVLGLPGNSRLHWALIDNGLAEEAACDLDARDGCGDYYVYASGDPDRLDKIERVVREELAMLGQSISEADLDKLRNKLALEVTTAGERPGGRMQRLGRDWTYLEQHLPLEKELARLNAVTLDDVKGVLKDFPFDKALVGRLLPEAVAAE
ncbi:MAG: pitrilysin family protein [Planctomycetota bacterium]